MNERELFILNSGLSRQDAEKILAVCADFAALGQPLDPYKLLWIVNQGNSGIIKTKNPNLDPTQKPKWG